MLDDLESGLGRLGGKLGRGDGIKSPLVEILALEVMEKDCTQIEWHKFARERRELWAGIAS